VARSNSSFQWYESPSFHLMVGNVGSGGCRSRSFRTEFEGITLKGQIHPHWLTGAADMVRLLTVSARLAPRVWVENGLAAGVGLGLADVAKNNL
jgi:hypothetical protein